MKRNITSTLSAIALAVIVSSSAMADVDVSLNVFPNDFSDLSLGGTWSLVAKTDTPNSAGIVALSTRFIQGTIPAAGTVNPNIGHDINGGVLVIGNFVDPNGPNFTEFLYAQNPDPNAGLPALVLGVGLIGGPSDIGPDPLGDAAWDNASEIAFGSIPDLTTIPAELLAAANEVEEVLAGGAIFAATVDQFVVRVAVPEPSSALLAFGALVGLGTRRRR